MDAACWGLVVVGDGAADGGSALELDVGVGGGVLLDVDFGKGLFDEGADLVGGFVELLLREHGDWVDVAVLADDDVVGAGRDVGEGVAAVEVGVDGGGDGGEGCGGLRGCVEAGFVELRLVGVGDGHEGDVGEAGGATSVRAEDATGDDAVGLGYGRAGGDDGGLGVSGGGEEKGAEES